MSGHIWSFEKINPRCPRRDPVEAEFFTGDPDSAEVERRVDTLIREVIQNSLDARDGGSRVEVVFHLPRKQGTISDPLRDYLRGLRTHLEAIPDLKDACRALDRPMRFLAIEDFGTRGLTGDPMRSEDPPGTSSQSESFYWFWRNIGRSAKGGDSRGRWGLGKTVLPASSRLSTFFGLTRRATDGRRLLMGQCILKVHPVDGSLYESAGYFHADRPGAIQAPIEESAVVDRFAALFNLDRRVGRSGVSLVIPEPFEGIDRDTVLRSVAVHFFLTVLKGDLCVRVRAGEEVTVVDHRSLEQTCSGLRWPGAKSSKRHRPPPIHLARKALAHSPNAPPYPISCLSVKQGAPGIPEGVTPVPEPDWNSLGKHLESHGFVGCSFNCEIHPVAESRSVSPITLFLERGESGPGDEYFVRQGMTITRVNAYAQLRNFTGLAVIDEGPLSSFLGDCEGPAHENWADNKEAVKRHYRSIDDTLTTIKGALKRFAHRLERLDEEKPDFNFLASVFSLRSPRGRSGRSPVEKQPLPPIPPSSSKLNVNRTQTGFSIRPTKGGAIRPGAILSMKMAYEVTRGSPFQKYSVKDFRIDQGYQQSLRVFYNGCREVLAEKNTLELRISGTDFRVYVEGFDEYRDVALEITLSGDQE